MRRRQASAAIGVTVAIASLGSVAGANESLRMCDLSTGKYGCAQTDYRYVTHNGERQVKDNWNYLGHNSGNRSWRNISWRIAHVLPDGAAVTIVDQSFPNGTSYRSTTLWHGSRLHQSASGKQLGAGSGRLRMTGTVEQRWSHGRSDFYTTQYFMWIDSRGQARFT